MSTSTDGTVTITGPGGSVRTSSRQPELQRFLRQTGDQGTLKRLSGGGYTLTETVAESMPSELMAR